MLHRSPTEKCRSCHSAAHFAQEGLLGCAMDFAYNERIFDMTQPAGFACLELQLRTAFHQKYVSCKDVNLTVVDEKSKY